MASSFTCLGSKTRKDVDLSHRLSRFVGDFLLNFHLRHLMKLVGIISVIDIEFARDGKNGDEPNDDWSIIPVQCLKATTSPFYQSS